MDDARAVLFGSASLAPGAIPRDVTASFLEHRRSDRGGVLRLDAAIGELRRYSLIEAGPDVVIVHPLVAVSIRNMLPTHQRLDSCKKALDKINRDFDFEPSSYWERCLRLVPHARRLLDEISDDTQTVGELSFSLGLFYLRRANFHDAAYQFTRALRTVPSKLYADDRRRLMRATLLSHLGYAYRGLGELLKARDVFCEAMAEIDGFRAPQAEAGHDREQRRVDSLLNLAAIAHDLGDHDEAKRELTKALAFAERISGALPVTLTCIHVDLAILYQDEADLDAAWQHAEQAVGLAQGGSAQGRDMPAMFATALMISGTVLRAQGQFEESRKKLIGALVLRRRIYGPTHPALATAGYHLGLVLRDLGRLGQARSIFAWARRIRVESYGRDNFLVASADRELGETFRELGEPNLAQYHVQQSLEVLQRFATSMRFDDYRYEPPQIRSYDGGGGQ